MKYHLKISLTFFTIIQFSIYTDLKSQTIILDTLFNKSDIVVQGTIKGMNCIQQEIGAVLCAYALQVDSVYKGIPDIYDIEGGEFIQAGQSMTLEEIERKLKIIYFSKDCLYYLKLQVPGKEQFNDQCFKIGDNMIVFLKERSNNVKELMMTEKNTRNSYSMTDQWLGALPGNSYVSQHLRSRLQGK